MRTQRMNIAAAVMLGFVPLLAHPALAKKPTHDPGTTVVDPLPYSLSYTITGNYVVGTVDFEPTNTNGFQT